MRESRMRLWFVGLLLMALVSAGGCSPAAPGRAQPTSARPVATEVAGSTTAAPSTPTETPSPTIAASPPGPSATPVGRATPTPHATSTPIIQNAPTEPISYPEVRLDIVTVPKATVFLDGKKLGKAPLQVVVPAGPHLIQAVAPGHELLSRWVFPGRWPYEQVVLALPPEFEIPLPWVLSSLKGAAWVSIAPNNRRVVIRDPDGFRIVELSPQGLRQETASFLQGMSLFSDLRWLWQGEGLLVRGVYYRGEDAVEEESCCRQELVLYRHLPNGRWEPRLLRANVDALAPIELSPDQRYLLLQWPQPDVALGVLGLDGSWRTLLSADEANDAPHSLVATWSPDGQWIAVAQSVPQQLEVGELSPWKLWRLNLATGERQRLAAGFEAEWHVIPYWSPDGRQIALVGLGNDTKVYFYNIEEGTLTESAYPGLGGFDKAIWSPDGRYLLVEEVGYCLKPAALWVISPRSGAMRKISEDQWYLPLRWQADGQAVLVMTWEEGTGYIITALPIPTDDLP